MKRENVGSVLGWCLVLSLILGIAVFGQRASAQTAEEIPLPEYYGTYAVSGGKLFNLEVEPVIETVGARIGSLTSLFDVCNKGAPVATAQDGPVAVLSADTRFLVFFQPSGVASPMMIAQHLNLDALAYVRNVQVEGCGNRNVPVRGAENAWDHDLGSVTMNVKPVPGHQEMVLVVPQSRLKPGIYVLSGGALKIRPVFAVTPLSEAERAKCSDVTEQFNMYMFSAGGKLFEKIAPCGTSSSASSEQPLDTQPTAAQPLAPVAVNCSDYDSCFSGGTAAYRSGQLDQSLGYFQKASTLDPSKGDAWAGIGAVYFETGRYDEAATMSDKALALGSTVSVDVCRQHLMSCDRGSFRMSTREVSLVSPGGQKVFSATPSEVTTQEAQLFTLKQAAYVGVRVSGKNYSLFYIPDRITCNFGLVPECPEPGFTQQKLFANYVHRTIQRMAAGEFAKTVQPATPKAGCDAATDLGYSLLAGGHLYKVKGITSPNGQVHVFFDEKGSPVQDQNMLQKLALGAWTRERIVAGSSTRNASSRISSILSASRSIQLDTALADFAARGMTEALEAVVTGGASLAKTVPNLTYGILGSQLLNSPRTFLIVAARTGLERSLDRYSQLGTILPPADATALDVTALETVKQLYTQAYVLELPNEALATAMMPTTITQQLQDLVGSMLSEVIPGAPDPTQLVTLDALFKLQKSLANAGRALPELQAYSESLENALKFAAEEDQVIGAWAKQAATACSR
jgi:tetratricopeptide (TPR) repeat protein